MAAAAGAALTVVLVGCGGGESHSSTAGASPAGDKAANNASKRTDAPTVLMAAAKKTAEQASYRTIQTGEGGSDKSEMLFQRQPYASAITSWGEKTADNPTGVTQVMVTGDVGFMKSGQIPGDRWYRMDKPATGGASNARAAGSVNEVAGALAATGSTSWVGEEQVGGRPADHYRGTVVFEELARYTGPAINDEVRDYYVQLAKRRGETSGVLDIWVGKDDLVLKSQQVTSGSKGQAQLLEEYSDFGTVPAITAPPAETVGTWDEFLAGMAKH
ncbi:hypothetical protein ABTY61_39760 [Kitasatospora sp. NPDC096128]|uniref:hypothetical protein n=1 Tax=Kitasatospora sp. NPDC096128 TaxID=3155547 RepID=UPI0033193947